MASYRKDGEIWVGGEGKQLVMLMNELALTWKPGRKLGSESSRQ